MPIDSTVVVDRNGVPLYEALGGDGTRARQMRPETTPIVAAATRRRRGPPVLVASRRRSRSRSLRAPGEPRARAASSKAARRSRSRSRSCCSTARAGRARGWRAKLTKPSIALRLEHRFDKREISALYLNLAAYGNQIAGAERASRATSAWPADADAGAGGVSRRPAAAADRVQSVSQPTLAIAAARSCCAHGMRPALIRAELRRARRSGSLRARSPFLAPHFVEMVLARRAARVPPHRDDARRRAAGRHRRHHQSQRAALDRHGAANVAVVVLDNAARRVAGLGRIRRLRRRRAHGGAINGVDVAAAAGIGAQAVHLRAGVRGRVHAGERAARRPVALSDRRAGRRLQPAQLRRPLSAVRCWRGGAGGIRRTCRRSRSRRSSACRRCCGSCARRVLDVRSDRGLLRPRPDARQRRSAARRAGGGVCGVRARRRVDRPTYGVAIAATGSVEPIPGEPAWCRRGPRSGSPTSSRTTTRASTSSGAAAASSSRSRSR